VSQDVDVVDLKAFHLRLGKCHELIDEVGILKHDVKGLKIVLDSVTVKRQQGIRGITRWREYTDIRFSAKMAEEFDQQYQECHTDRVTGYLKLIHQAQAQPDHVIDLEREYPIDELRAHYRSYVDLLAKQKRIEDLLAVEKKHLKVAIGTSQSFRNLFSWSRRRVTEVDPTAFRTKHPDLYKKCKVTTSTWKCEILPFRG
jgi:hypothetical protein